MIAGTRSGAQLMSGGRPLSSTRITGFLVASTAEISFIWSPGKSSDARELASPVIPASSPTKRITVSAFFAALTASSMLAGLLVVCTPLAPVADVGAGAATPAASPRSNGGISAPLAYSTCSFPNFAEIPSSGVTASLACPLPAQAPSCEALSSASGPITATVWFFCSGSNSCLFCSNTIDSCAILRSICRLSGVRISVFSRFGSKYGCSNNPASNFTRSTRRTASSTTLSGSLPDFTRSGINLS